MTTNELKATGDCYEAAFSYMMDHHAEEPTLRLVHGVCLLGAGPHEGLPFGHAWCEVEHQLMLPEELPPGFEQMVAPTMKFAIDKSNGRDIWMPAPLYYYGGRPQQIIRYTYTEMCEWAVRTGHYGHWELEVER